MQFIFLEQNEWHGVFYFSNYNALNNGLYFVLNPCSGLPYKMTMVPLLINDQPFKSTHIFNIDDVLELKWYSLTPIDTVLRQEHMLHLSL